MTIETDIYHRIFASMGVDVVPERRVLVTIFAGIHQRQNLVKFAIGRVNVVGNCERQLDMADLKIRLHFFLGLEEVLLVRRKLGFVVICT